MEWKYLNNWVQNVSLPQSGLKSILAFEDQYQISFKNNKTMLQVSLNQKDCFPFLTKDDSLPFDTDSKINNISQMLGSARIDKVELEANDRIIKLWFKKRDIYNQTTTYALVLELIPRFQNIILCRFVDDELIIAEALRKFSFAENNQRQILLNIPYVTPETTYKVADREITLPLKIDTDSYKWEGSDTNNMFENLFHEVELKKRLNERKKVKLKQVKRQIKKANTKLEKQSVELLSAEKETEWSQKAELLKPLLRQIKSGQDSIEVVNYYSENQESLTIKLFKNKKPLENLQYYLKKYKKARSGFAKITSNIKATKAEIEDLNREYASVEEIDSYTEILALSKGQKHGHRQHHNELPFRRIRINADWEIMIGRKAKENDLLTCRVAKSQDWWFHTRIYQGTHVVLRNYSKLKPTDELMEVCCRLAAYYSKAKTSINVPVDYTQIRYVTKPHSAAPGYVIYKNQKTVFVNPIDFREARGLLIKLGYLQNEE
ncbi:MAG: NFACT RNA binding domain-containing protein [Candidatus Zophobacter franzmannii]|nr:NFACT RNA binding domain-containing protein [Candidatus Zophobacter franzmannii]